MKGNVTDWRELFRIFGQMEKVVDIIR